MELMRKLLLPENLHLQIELFITAIFIEFQIIETDGLCEPSTLYNRGVDLNNDDGGQYSTCSC